MTRPTLRSPTLLAVLVAAVAFAVYHLTLYPGLVGSGDTPRLQFVGRVLGTAHTPGYPLYVLVSHLFGELPVGSLAFRINLMSAVFGALAAALVFALARRSSGAALPAAAAALGFAFGRVFWSQSILAEVYSLAAALLAGFLLVLVGWGESPRPLRLYAAAGIFALGLAHHHADMVLVLPAAVLYVLATDARQVLRPRVLAGVAGIALLGLAAYAFVLIRTLQGAPYLGARAGNLSELASVLSGGPFARKLFAFGPRALLDQRLPRVAGILAAELGPLGGPLALLGGFVLLRRRPREALLLLLAAAGSVAFALNYDAADLEVFLIPAFVALAPVEAVGLAAAVGWLARPAPVPRVATWILLLAVPTLPLVTNYRLNDHHDRVFEQRYFGRLLAWLPDHSAVVRESDVVDSMMLYELLGEDAARGRDVILIPADPASVEASVSRGYAVFAFQRAEASLASAGFPFVPVTLLDGPLAERLAGLTPGMTVALAGSPGPALEAALAALHALGGGRPQGQGLELAAIGLTGARGGALERAGSRTAEVAVSTGGAIGTTGGAAPVGLRALSRDGAASIRVAGREVLRVEDGVAVAVVAPSGKLVERLEADTAAGLRTAFPTGYLQLFRLAAPRRCVFVTRKASEVTSVTGWGRLQVHLAGGSVPGHLVLWASRHRPLDPRLGKTRGAPSLQTRTFHAGAPELSEALARDGLSPEAAARSGALVSRIEVRMDAAQASRTFAVDLRGLPEWAAAVADPGARLCAEPAGEEAFLAGDRPRVKLDLGRRGLPWLGAGWGGDERDGPHVVRPVAARAAEVLLPLIEPLDLTVEVEARLPRGREAARRVELVVNGRASEPREIGSDWVRLAWAIPASRWRAGANQVWLRLSGSEPSSTGLEVRAFHLTRAAAPAAAKSP